MKWEQWTFDLEKVQNPNQLAKCYNSSNIVTPHTLWWQLYFKYLFCVILEISGGSLGAQSGQISN